MKQFLLTFLGSFSGIITAFIVLNFLKGFRNLIFSDKALDYKVFKNFLEKKCQIIDAINLKSHQELK